MRIERDAKEFAAILKPLGYRRKSVSVQAASHVTLCDLNWSGGTRSTYHSMTIDGHALANTEQYSKLAPWVNHAEGAKVELPQGAILVRLGFFCGKVALATIYVNPSDMPRLLPMVQP